MLPWVSALAVLLYLAPVLILWVCRSSRERAAWELGLDVPFAVAVDLLLVLFLACAMRLAVAVLVARALWLVGAVARIAGRWKKGDPPRWPQAIGKHEGFGVLLAAWASVHLSMALSRTEAIWDRELHVPLESSLRAQSIPFHNVFEPGKLLRYHFTGDTVASLLQTLSAARIGGHLALSLEHDVMFGLIAASLALLLAHFVRGRATTLVLGAFAILLTGPSALRGSVGQPFLGFNYHAFLSVSFRPHTSLAGLLLVGWVGAVLVRALETRTPERATVPVLLATTAVLAITDEPSLGLLGIGLGVAWLVEPRLVAETRLRGLAVFGLLAVVAVLSIVVFHGALRPGGPVTSIRLTDWRNPGFVNPPMRDMREHGAWDAIISDALPFGLCLTGLVSLLASLRSRALAASVSFVATFSTLGLLALMRLEINHSSNEVQRFMLVPSYVGPLVALLWLHRTPVATFARATIVGGLGFAAFSTLAWMREYAPSHDASAEALVQHGIGPYAVDCRELAGARMFEPIRPAYVDDSVFDLWTGCHPVFVAGRVPAQSWDIRIHPLSGPTAMQQLDDEVLKQDELLDVICPIEGGDSVCQRIPFEPACRRVGVHIRRCLLTWDERRAIEGR